MLRRVFSNNVYISKLYLTTPPEFSKPHLESRIVVDRTISKEDVEQFSKLTGDNNCVHCGPSGVVHGTFLNGLVSSVIGTQLPGHGTLVLSQNLIYPNSCPIGSTVTITVEVTSWRKIISCVYDIKNKKDNTVVLQGDAKLILKKTG